MSVFSEMPARLLPWFAVQARALPWRSNREPYRVWLSEIMLQQTRVEAVKPYYLRFLEALPDIPALAECPADRLMKLWEGLGYYSRARNLQRAAQVIVASHGGIFPQSYDAIRALPGIGDYTAGAVASICFDLPEPAVDGNVLRVVTRLCADSRCTDDPAVKREIRGALRSVYEALPAQERGTFTQALMELGATVCVPNGAPHCAECPCADLCAAHAEGTEMRFPVRREKKQRRILHYTVYLLECGGRFAVRKRPEEGLLGGLWELPHTDGSATVQEAVTNAAEWDIGYAEPVSVRKKKHIFTHIEWRMTVVHLLVSRASECLTWVTPAQLAGETALPTAFRICLPEPPAS